MRLIVGKKKKKKKKIGQFFAATYQNNMTQFLY